MTHRYLKAGAAAVVLALAACGGESATNGEVGDVQADTSRNWTEVIAQTDEGGYRMGNPDAPVKVVEFASLTCSHCAHFSGEAAEPLASGYVSQGTVSFEVRNFVRDPLDLTMALLARCGNPDGYFVRAERMFANQPQFFQTIQGASQADMQALQNPQAIESGQAFVGFARLAGLIDFVGGLGVSEQQAQQCLTDSAARDQLVAMRDAAISQYNLQGTPTFLINGEVASDVSSWPQLKARLDAMTQQ